MINKQLIKNIFKVIIFLVIPFGMVVNFLWGFYDDVYTGLELSTEEMQPMREINQDALEGFEIFPMMRENSASIEYDLFASNEPKGAFSFDDNQYLAHNIFEVLTLDAPQDTIYVIFENYLTETILLESSIGEMDYGLSRIRDTFILKLFYNHEEIAFRPLNQAYFDTEFLFLLSEGYQVHIPITLCEELVPNDYLNNLTIAIFGTPERHTIDPQAMFWYRFDDEQYFLNDWGNGIVQNFAITYGGNGIQTLHGVYHDVKVFQNIDEYQPLNIVHEFNELGGFDEFNKIAVSMVTSSPLRVNPSEEIELMFSSSLGSSFYYLEPESEEAIRLENYLVIALLNWEQVEINGLPYLLVDVSDNFIRYETRQGKFRIQAPEEPGFYDFVAFAVPNLANPPGISRVFSPLTFRFTIEVE